MKKLMVQYYKKKICWDLFFKQKKAKCSSAIRGYSALGVKPLNLKGGRFTLNRLQYMNVGKFPIRTDELIYNLFERYQLITNPKPLQGRASFEADFRPNKQA